MSLFKRISDNLRANLNSMLDKAEDPVKLLEQYLRDMEDDIVDAEGAVAKQLAVVYKFKSQVDETQAIVQKRETQAVEALQKGREDLARKALMDKKLHQSKVEDYQTQYENANNTAERLKGQLKEMKTEYEKLKAKKDSLMARMQAAKVQKNVYGLVNGFGKDNARRGFDRMEAKVLELEAQAQVAGDLRGEVTNLDDELAKLGDADIESELNELKAKLEQEK